MARRVKSTVDNGAILQMFNRGGQIERFSEKVSLDVLASARRKAPRRTGLLKASMFADRIGTNGYANQISVYNTAPYALHVEEDTVGTTKWVRLYAGGRTAPARWRYSQGAVVHGVQGYKGKHFMAAGLRIGLRKHGIKVV